MPDIQPADPVARRRALWMMALSVAVVAMVALVMDDWLAGVMLRDPALARPVIAGALRWVTAVVALSVAAFAVYAWLLGRRITSARRFPPPGMAVMRDTVVLDGAPARRRGLLIQGIAIALAALALLLVVAMFVLAARLG